MPRSMIQIDCRYCGHKGEVRCNASSCPACKRPFVSANPENERHDLLRENQLLRGANQDLRGVVGALEAENHLLRQELNQ